ncbi:hypothetical protein [Novilysobacter erysipheiresistens]|uniref:Uncharacterized protein n=1 Tax=Novilysobacter erysipheiresistens TaxID=1749332 RepID=A0ABU7YUH2_9GAMM
MGQFIPLAIGLAGAAAQSAETKRVERKQDDQLAMSLIEQGKKQKEADTKVNEEVQELQASTAADERADRLDEYMQGLQRGRKGWESGGIDPAIGGDAFKADSAKAAEGVQQYAADTAGLVARMDAPGLQRQGEAFGYGNLTTDLGLIGRESQGQRFIDELRMRAIRRNPNVDLAAGVASGVAGAMGGGGMGGSYTGTAGQQPYMTAPPSTAGGANWLNAYGGGR